MMTDAAKTQAQQLRDNFARAKKELGLVDLKFCFGSVNKDTPADAVRAEANSILRMLLEKNYQPLNFTKFN